MQIELPADVAQGTYANLAMITHSTSEFILDFIRIMPGVPKGTVKSRLNYARKSIKQGVEAYERKGIKLYSVSPFLLLVFYLRQEASACVPSGSDTVN